MDDVQGNCLVKRMKLSELKMAEYNPRKISDEAFKGLGGSIDRFGVLVPIVWNKRTGNIVGGHQRYRYLVEQGETETDVIVVDLDGNEEIALNITLNNPNIRGKFTNEVASLLKLSEVQLGNAFAEIGLTKLFEKLKVDQVTPQPSGSGGSGSGGGGGEPEPSFPIRKEPSQPEAMITCPKCRSKWRMRDNFVVHNAEKKEGV